MSTDYYIPCEDCIKEVKHIHRQSDLPVAQTYHDGKKLVVDHKSWIFDDTILMSEYGSIHTLAEIKDKLK